MLNTTKIKQMARKWAETESPSTVYRMVADELSKELMSYRARSEEYLIKRANQLTALSNALHAEHCALNLDSMQLLQMKYRAMGAESLKLEAEKQHSYEENVVLGSVLRELKQNKLADVINRRREIQESEHCYDPEFQSLLGDACAQESSLSSGSLVPIMELENIRHVDAANGRVAYQSIDSIVSDIVGPKHTEKVMELVKGRVPSGHISPALAKVYTDLNGYRKTVDATLEESVSGMAPDVKADFLEKAARVGKFMPPEPMPVDGDAVVIPS